MDFWNELSQTISAAADQTIKGTEKLTGIAKLKYRLGSLKNKQNECYQNIGRLRFAEFNGETVSEDMYAGFFTQAAELDFQIQDCQTKLFKLQELTSCPQCGYHTKKGLPYCPKCGEKQNSTS